MKWLQKTYFAEEPTTKNGYFLKIWKVAVCNFRWKLKHSVPSSWIVFETEYFINIFEVAFHFCLVTEQFHVQYESSKTVTKIIIPKHILTCSCFRCIFRLFWGMCSLTCCQGVHTLHVLANSHSLQWDLVGVVMLGQRLNLMVLEFFSSLYDSMIPSLFMIVSHVLLPLGVFWDMHLMCLWAISVKFRHQDRWKVHQ